MAIIDDLVQIRKEKKIRQHEIYSQLGIVQGTLSIYENKKRDIPSEILVKYAELLGYELRLIKK